MKKLPRVTTFNLVFQEPSNGYKYVTMTRNLKNRIFHSITLNIFLRVFVQYLLYQEKFIGQKLVLFYFLPLLHSYKKLFKRPTIGDCFQEKLFLVETLNTRDQRSLGSLQEAGFASWLITGHKRPTSFGFIARSGYNFLVVITRHKGPKFLGVHCKKWA